MSLSRLVRLLAAGGACSVFIALVPVAVSSAAPYPQVVETSSLGTITGGLAPAGIPDWTPPNLAKPLVAMAATPDDGGAWEVGADGGVFAFGDAGFYGSMGDKRLSTAVKGIASTPDGGGYWLTASDGGVFAFGDAPFFGSLPGLGVHPAKPVVGIAATPDGGGYWLVATDGGVFAFGDARYEGSLPGIGVSPAQPVIGIADFDRGGYWLAATDGGVFAFGDAPFLGSGTAPFPAPIVAIVRWPGKTAYTLIQADELLLTLGAIGPPVLCTAELQIIVNPSPALTAVGGAVVGLGVPTPCAYP